MLVIRLGRGGLGWGDQYGWGSRCGFGGSDGCMCVYPKCHKQVTILCQLYELPVEC